MNPICIDLFCGLGGWAEGFLAEGYRVAGFDIERHDYGTGGYPGELVLQDALTLHGSQFRNAACIVASPPCQEFSYMAMPWSRAKQIARALRGDGEFPEGYTGSRTIAELTALFDACFRIQREASEAAGRHIPMVVENVRGAQPWVGRAPWNYGSFYLWGDVPALMPFTWKSRKNGDLGGSWFPQGNGARLEGNHGRDGLKVPNMNFHEYEKTGKPGRSFQSAAVDAMRESSGTHDPRESDIIRNLRIALQCAGIKQHGSGAEWFDRGIASHGSASKSRKAASAAIAKIPFDLAAHIARCFKPCSPCASLVRFDTCRQRLYRPT